MKKNYVKPEIQVVTINHSVQLLAGTAAAKDALAAAMTTGMMRTGNTESWGPYYALDA